MAVTASLTYVAVTASLPSVGTLMGTDTTQADMQAS